MDNLEKQIWDRYGNFELSHDKNEAIVNSIKEFVEKHSKDFAEFYFINEFNSDIYNSLTVNELFQLYIERLCQE